jgi:PAS domain S-box-containing protein
MLTEGALQNFTNLMLKHVSVGMALFDAHDLCLLTANAYYYRLYQETREPSLATTLAGGLPEPERAKILAIFRTVIDTGVVFRADAYAITEPRRGTTYWNCELEPIMEDGQVRYVLLTVTDVTAQTLAHQQRHQSVEMERARLHTILDQLPEGVLLVEAAAGTVSYANTAASHLLHIPLSRLIGSTLKEAMFIAPDSASASRWSFPLIHALWGKTITNQELTITHPDGSEIVVLGSAAPIRALHGFIDGAALVFQDITNMKRLEQQKNDFFAAANHELRTPLTVIMGFAELLQMDARGSNMQQYAVSSILRESTNLLQLVHDLLDVSRLDQRKLEIQRAYQDVLSPLREIINTYVSSTRTHRLSFSVYDLDASDVLMGWFDLPRIELAVRNLISNATKYSSAGSAIEVGIRPHRDAQGTPRDVILWVKDQGIGIAPQDLPHIFERFYRASSHASSVSGFGMGLYLAKVLIQQHGGRIWVESQIDQGSTFFVMLPLGENKQ